MLLYHFNTHIIAIANYKKYHSKTLCDQLATIIESCLENVIKVSSQFWQDLSWVQATEMHVVAGPLCPPIAQL